MTVDEYVAFVRSNYTDEQIMLALEVKTEQQAREIIGNPIMYPLFMTKHIHKLGYLTGHKLAMIDI